MDEKSLVFIDSGRIKLSKYRRDLPYCRQGSDFCHMTLSGFPLLALRTLEYASLSYSILPRPATKIPVLEFCLYLRKKRLGAWALKERPHTKPPILPILCLLSPSDTGCL